VRRWRLAPRRRRGSRGPSPCRHRWRPSWRGIRRGEYFESHEVLEKAWLHSRSDFYHGLIILAAAFVRRDRGTPRGVRRNLLKARRYLERYRPHYLGIDVERILAFIDRYARLVEEAGDPEGEALRRPGAGPAPGGGPVPDPGGRTGMPGARRVPVRPAVFSGVAPRPGGHGLPAACHGPTPRLRPEGRRCYDYSCRNGRRGSSW